MGQLDTHKNMLEALRWQIELGATEAICDKPIDRYALETAPPKAPKSPAATANVPDHQKQIRCAKHK